MLPPKLIIWRRIYDRRNDSPRAQILRRGRMSAAHFESPFGIGERVIVDGCEQLVASVTAVLWRNENPLIEISWIDGQARTAWIEPWRIKSRA
jgi:hypothetical protein